MFPNSERRGGRFHELARPRSDDGHVCAPRAARLPRFIGGQRPVAASLDELTVAVVGAGGAVGRRLSLHLARLQPKALWLIDRGRYKPESLLTHEIGPDAIRQPKATSTGLACQQVSGRTKVCVYDGAIQELPAAALTGAALVAMATDNLSAEVEVGQRCMRLAIPLVQASVHGDSLVVQVRFFGNQGARGPCPACLFGDAELQHLQRETVFACDGSVPPLGANPMPPTMSASFLCSLAADLAMIEIARHTLGLGAAPDDTMLQYCGYTHQTRRIPLTRNAACCCEHRPYKLVAHPRALGSCRPAELLTAAGWTDRARSGVSLAVDNLVFVESARCCGELWPVRRFVAPRDPCGNCPGCGATLTAEPFYTHSSAPLELLDRDRTLAVGGAEQAESVLLRCDDEAVLLWQGERP